MKKLLLFVAVLSISMSSCSGDDNGDSQGTNTAVQATIDGATTSFSEVEVVRENQRLYITAMTSDHSQIITFENDLGYTGKNEMIYPEYRKNDDVFDDSETSTFLGNIEISNEHKLKGMFQGTLVKYDYEHSIVTGTVTITEGTFDIAY